MRHVDLLRPIARHPLFFFSATLLGAASPLAADIAGHCLFARFTTYALCQSAAVAFALCCLFCKWRSRAPRIAVLCLLSLWALIEAGHAAAVGRVLDPASVSMAKDTTPGETMSFLRQYFPASAIVRTALIMAAVAFASIAAASAFRYLYRLRHARIAISACMVLTAAAGILGIGECLSVLRVRTYDEFLVWQARDNGNPDLARIYRMNYSDTYTKAVWLVKNMQMEMSSLRMWEHTQRQYLGQPAPVGAGAGSPTTVVTVIGESFIKSHSSLYGYYLPTNPRLQQEMDSGRIVAFSDVISAADFTIQSLRNLLNLNCLAEGRQWYEALYWPLVAHHSGWHTYLYSNQYAPSRAGTGLNGMLYHPALTAGCYTATADTCLRYDHDFVDRVKQRFIPAEDGDRRLVIWHLLGQHFQARDRVPDQPRYRHFSAADITVDRPWLDLQRRAEIAEYDNATLYNDSVVASIIDIYRHRDAILFYFSDHGEEIWDTAPYASRNEQHPDDASWLHRHFDIPFFVWMSDSLMKSHPDLADKVRRAASRPLMLDNFGQTILGITGAADALYRPQLDVLSDSYTPVPRVTCSGYEYDNVTKHRPTLRKKS